ncbi:MAG: hypothetical protein COB73_00245 [Flavobacteriaceae bacterium]|nr:MAG: hypothetical protein COB73_00245 [Flavobacteriaceae bacterium]
METVNQINFKKYRDLGAIITDTFLFIRDNWKGYFGTVIKIAGPALVVLIVAMGYYMISLGGVMEGFTTGNEFSETDGLEAIFAVAIAMVSGVVFYVLMQMSSLYYIKSYIKNNGVADLNEVKQNVSQNFWRFLGYGILMILIVGLGTVLCFLPGIYLGVVLSLGTSILVFEGKSVGDAISHSFTLIKDHWWETFGVIFVVGLLVGILGMVFSVPTMIYQMGSLMTNIGQDDPTAMFEVYSDPIYLGLAAISYIGQFLLSSITLIASVFIYYDLNEQKNLTGTIEQIDSLGSL